MTTTPKPCPVCSKEGKHVVHNGVCSSCPHSADVQAGRYANKQFSATPCFGCRHADSAMHVGHDKVLHVDASILHGVATPKYDDEADRHTAFADFLRGLMAMPNTTREIVFKRLRGLTFREIAEDLTALHGRAYTVQAVHRRFVQCIQRYDAICAMFPSIQADVMACGGATGEPSPSITTLVRELFTLRQEKDDIGRRYKARLRKIKDDSGSRAAFLKMKATDETLGAALLAIEAKRKAIHRIEGVLAKCASYEAIGTGTL